MAYRPIGLCGMGKERTKGKGLEGGHTLQAKEMTHLVAPFRARYYCPGGPQATQAAGLVQAFELLGAINNFTACPNADNRKKQGYTLEGVPLPKMQRAFSGLYCLLFSALAFWYKNFV